VGDFGVGPAARIARRVRGRTGVGLGGLAVVLISVALVAYVPRVLPGLPQRRVDEPGPRPLIVRFLNVGQGDAAWLSTPDGRTVLIDCGPTSFGPKLVAELVAAGVGQVDFLAPSHAHADHVGGCIEVVRRLPVGELLWTGQTDSSQTWRTFWAEVSGRGVAVTHLHAGQVFEWGDGATASVLNPREGTEADARTRSGSARDEFDDSHVLLVEYFGTRLLFVGDLHARGEQRLLTAGTPLQAHILKVAEHGSAAGSSMVFLEAVRPRVAVLSYGVPNAYDLPDPVVMERLEAIGAQVLRTADVGTITITVSGYSVSTER